MSDNVPREKLAKKLIRVCEDINRDGNPLGVEKLYVFGSFARGAPLCHDLDLALIAGQTWNEAADAAKVLRKRDWRITFPIKAPRGTSIDNVLCNIGDGSAIDEKVLIWDDTHTTAYAERINAISVVEGEGRKKRSGIDFDFRRGVASFELIERLHKLVKRKEIVYESIDLAAITPNLKPEQRDRLARAAQAGSISKKTLEALPYGFHWLNSERAEVDLLGARLRSTIWTSQMGTHLLKIGRINLRPLTAMFAWEDFGEAKKDVKLAAIGYVPHLRKSRPNKMLVLRRGPKWQGYWQHGWDT